MKLNLDSINRQLASLPELPANVELEIQTSLINFADSARTKVEEFRKSFNQLPSDFRNCLLHMKPKIALKDKSDTPILELSDDESDAGSVASHATPTKRRNGVAAVTPNKRPRLNGSQSNGGSFNGGSFNGNIKPEEGRGSCPPPPSPARGVVLPEPFLRFSDGGRGFRTIRQVREEILAKTTAGMPNRIPEKVYEDLAMEAVKPWNQPMEAFLKETMRLLRVELDVVLNKAFEGLKKRFVYKEAKKILHRYLEEYRERTAMALRLLYNDETSQLLTFNDTSFNQYEKEEKDILKHFRHHVRMNAAMLPTQPHVAWDTLTEEKRTQELKRREVEKVKLGLDQFEREVEVVAYVRGYYRLAALRFADTVSQCVICRMIPDIRRQLPNYLEEKLGVRGPDALRVYERLMEEDEQTATKREALKGERTKFETALASIAGLEMGGGEVQMLNGLVNGQRSISRAAVRDVVMMEQTVLDDEA